MSKGFKITPVNKAGTHRTGALDGITYQQICDILGFEPNVDDDPDKVEYSWGFTVNGIHCGIWDYKGSHKFNVYSTYGPITIFEKLFGEYYA